MTHKHQRTMKPATSPRYPVDANPVLAIEEFLRVSSGTENDITNGVSSQRSFDRSHMAANNHELKSNWIGYCSRLSSHGAATNVKTKGTERD